MLVRYFSAKYEQMRKIFHTAEKDEEEHACQLRYHESQGKLGLCLVFALQEKR